MDIVILEAGELSLDDFFPNTRKKNLMKKIFSILSFSSHNFYWNLLVSAG